MLIDSLIQRKVVVLHADSPALQAARTLSERNIGCVPVCGADGGLVGIVTDRDLACSLATESEKMEVKISDIMTPRPITVREDAEVEEVVHLMEESGVRRVPVVQRTPAGILKCVGLVTLDDLVVSRAVPFERIARIVEAQIRRKWLTPSKERRASRAEARSEAHRDQTLHHFYRVIGEKTQLISEDLPELTRYLLGSLTRRIHYTGAAHFIAQLPADLKEGLLSLPAGPDREVTPARMLEYLMSRFLLVDKRARVVLVQFFSSLSQLVDPAEIENVKAQLPEEFKKLFSGKPESVWGKKAVA